MPRKPRPRRRCEGIVLATRKEQPPLKRCRAAPVAGGVYCVRHEAEADRQDGLRSALKPGWEHLMQGAAAPKRKRGPPPVELPPLDPTKEPPTRAQPTVPRGAGEEEEDTPLPSREAARARLLGRLRR